MTDVDARPQQATSQVTGEYAYQRGFGNEFASEAVAGALPAGRNSPQRAPLGFVLIDGVHRTYAHWKLGKETIEAYEVLDEIKPCVR